MNVDVHRIVGNRECLFYKLILARKSKVQPFCLLQSLNFAKFFGIVDMGEKKE